jgi:predicted dehydrogenase
VFFARARIGKNKSGYDYLESELRDYPGGTFFELGCHPLDFIIGLMGEPTSITGFLRTDYRYDTPLADNTVGVVQFAGGLAVVESSMMEIQPFQHRRLEVYGTEGTAILQPFDATSIDLTLEHDHRPYLEGTQQVDAGSWPAFVGDIKEFVACIRREKEPEYSASHDLAVQKALLTACGVA